MRWAIVYARRPMDGAISPAYPTTTRRRRFSPTASTCSSIFPDTPPATDYRWSPAACQRNGCRLSWLGYPGTTGVGACRLSHHGRKRRAGFRRLSAHRSGGAVCPRDASATRRPTTPPAPVDPAVAGARFCHLRHASTPSRRSSPDVGIALWGQVLAAVPRSRLRLKWKSFADAAVRQSFTEKFVAAGVSAERLELQGFSPHDELLAAYGQVDIALDPFPFSGGMTSLEALWMGVPVLTLHGERSASRHLSQQFKYLELDDCVARSPRDYVEKARALASDPSRLASLRAVLRPRMAASQLCDGPLFAAGLERSFREMWRRWCGGERASSFDVAGRLGCDGAA